MTSRDLPDERSRNSRIGGAIVGGYAGFAFGLLAVVSTASEVEKPTVGGAAFIVLVCMLAGCMAGFVLQPVLRRLFGQPE